MKKQRIIFALLVAGISASDAVPPPTPHGAVPDAKQLEWHDMEVYGLLCFNMATFKNVEWDDGATPVEKFNPTDFNPGQIMKACKAGGLNGIIFVAKHHDGFCMWPSKTTGYSIKNTPWKNGKGDLLKEFVDATRAEGMKVGMYLSPWDRNHATYGKPAYVEVYREQLRELMTGYGSVFEFWIDGANGGTGWYGGPKITNRSIDNKTYYDWPNTFRIVRELQPEACIFSDAGPDVRWNGNEHGGTGGACWATIDNSRHSPGRADTGLLNRGTRGGASWIPAESDFPLRMHPKGWYHHPGAKPATPAELVSIYFKTVGNNTSMNIGIAPDTRGQLCDDDVASLEGFGERIQAIFATNLAQAATVTASNVRGNAADYAAGNAVSGKKEGKYWAADDAVLTPDLTLDFGKPITFSVISLREQIQLGHRIDDFALDSWQHGEWKEFAAGTCIGSRKLWRGQPITSDKIRLRITKAADCPAICEFGVYLEPEASRKEAGKGIASHQEAGLSKNGWKIVSATSEGAPAANAIDGNTATFWHSHTNAGPQACPQEIVVDMGKSHELAGLLYTPRQDGCPVGNIADFAFSVSADGITWAGPVATGEFANIVNSPDQRKVMFAKSATGRYFKFTAVRSANGIPVNAAEIGVLGK